MDNQISSILILLEYIWNNLNYIDNPPLFKFMDVHVNGFFIFCFFPFLIVGDKTTRHDANTRRK